MGGLVIVLLLACAAVFALLSGISVLRHSSVFQDAVTRAHSNPQVVSELGEPVHPGRLISGKLRARGQFGFADFDVPLIGSRGEGTLSGLAFRVRGQWQFPLLEVDIEGSPSIDLLQAENAK